MVRVAAAAGLLALKATGSLGYIFTPQTPVSVDLVVSPATPVLGTEDQDLNAFPLAKTANNNGVDQLRLSLGGEGEMYITWHTGVAAVVNATLGRPADPDTSYAAKVSYGLHPDPTGKYERSVTDCEKTFYIQDYSKNVTAPTTLPGNPQTYYVSQVIVHCLLKDLLPKTKYYYRAGAPGGYSVEYAFTTPPAKGSNFPVKMGVIADVGNTQNSTSTLQHLNGNKPDFFTIIGDLVYADTYTSLGVSTLKNGVSVSGTRTSQTYQPYWDAFGRQLQTFANSASIPVQALAGNHEIERDDTLVPFKSVTARFKTAYAQSMSPNPLYYSVNYGGVHLVMLHAYDGPIPNAANPGFANGGNYPQTSFTDAQVNWLKADLAAVDRTLTPWVVVQMHPPYYNSYVSHYKEIECLQQQIEDIIYNAGVDFVMHGHVHAYERQNRSYKYRGDPCAPVYVTLGDAGNVEYGIRQYADVCYTGVTPVPVTCLNADNLTARVVSTTVPTAASRCTTFQNYAGQLPGRGANITAAQIAAGAPVGYFIPGQQPPYSAYRNPSFGHGIVEFTSATEATLSWYANQFSNAVATDVEKVVRDPSCPNQKGGFSNKPPAAPSAIGQAADALNSIVDGRLVNSIVNHTTDHLGK